MGRGSSYALARVAVYLRAAAGAWWWTGLVAAGIGAAVPGWTGRRIGVMAAAVLFLIVMAVTYGVRRGRYKQLLDALGPAGKWVVLRDRKATASEWRRTHRWWLALAFVLAVASAAVLPGAGGAVLAGVGAGLWLKSVWLGRWEERNELLLWVRPEWAEGRSPVRKEVRGWMTTGPLAGDSAPGGARRTRRAAGAGAGTAPGAGSGTAPGAGRG